MFKIGDLVKLRNDVGHGTFKAAKGDKGYVIDVTEEKYIKLLFPARGHITVMNYEIKPTGRDVEKQVKGKNLKLWDKIYMINDRWGEVYGLEQNGKDIDVSIWIDNDMEYITLGKKERVRIKR